MRRGKRRPRMTEVAAAASGGEIIAPSVSPAAQLMPGISQAQIVATASVVAVTKPNESSRMGRRKRQKSRQEVK